MFVFLYSAVMDQILLHIMYIWEMKFWVKGSQILPVLTVGFCHLRPEPPSPGQTNGISTPEQLTGRFQVRP